MMCPIVRKVTALAHGPQIARVVVFWGMVQVGNRQDDTTAGHWMRLIVFGAAVRVARAALTAVPRALQDGGTTLPPVFGVAVDIFRPYRHRVPPLSLFYPISPNTIGTCHSERT